MVLFNDNHSPAKIRWDKTASALGLDPSYRRNSRSMGGEIGELSVHLIDIDMFSPLLFIEPLAGNDTRFSIHLRADDESVLTLSLIHI